MQILTNLKRLLSRNSFESTRRNTDSPCSNSPLDNMLNNHEHLKRLVFDELPNVDEVTESTVVCVYDEGYGRVNEYCVIDGAWKKMYDERTLTEEISARIDRLLEEERDCAMDTMERLREAYQKMETKSDEPLIPLVCKNCGSPLEYHKGMDTLKCKYCDTEFLINK